jgi:hypothetical protein
LANEELELATFNRGIVSQLAIARTDIKRVNLSADEQVNYIPRVLGPMSLRPGQEYINATKDNSVAFNIPFVFAFDDLAIVQLTDLAMRVAVDDVFIQRPSVTTSVTNGTFDTNLTGWTDNDQVGCTSDWLAGGFMSLLGNGTGLAIRDQTLTVAAGSQTEEHALNIVVSQGELILRIGTTSGGDELFSETTLRTGFHSIAFTPNVASVYVRLQARTTYPTIVDEVLIAPAGFMELETPWTEDLLPNIRYEQSGDVIFVACGPTIRQLRIERRSTRSWSVVDYEANFGPFRTMNVSELTVAVSAITGAITLTASGDIFKPSNVGGLFAVNSLGQTVTRSISAQNQFTNDIRVTGIGQGRRFGVTVTGLTGTGNTVTLQRSVGAPGAWVDVITYTTNQATTYLDALDNQIIYYRIGIATGGYSSGTTVTELAYTAGSIKGIARIVGYTSPTVVTGIVVKPFGALTASPDWAEGSWSPRRGYPTAVALYEGRLFWAGRDKIDGSVSDDFANYSDEVEGDAGPINRSIGSGPVDTINWLVPAQILLLGGQGSEFICRSSSLGEPLTPANFNLKEASSRGSLRVSAVKVDTSAIFVDRSKSRVYELQFDAVSNNYSPADLTSIVPEICISGVVRIGVQRRPDTRFYFILEDGRVAIMVFDKTEDVKAWCYYETNGFYEDVVVLPGTEEDRVYFVVRRTINGSTVRYFEKVALQTECEGDTITKLADSFLEYDGETAPLIPNLAHLEGEEVVVWADGEDIGTYTVEGGTIYLDRDVTQAIVGLGYSARYKSAKLGRITKKKKITRLALVLQNTHAQGLRYGNSFETLDDLPMIEDHEVVDPNSIWGTYDKDTFEVNGVSEYDARLCLESAAPRPCTILAAVVDFEQNG